MGDKMTQNLQDNRRTVHHFKKKIEDYNKNKNKKESYNTPEIHIKRANLRSTEIINEHRKSYTNPKFDDPINTAEEDKEVHNANVNNDKQKKVELNLPSYNERKERETEIKLENF